MVSLESSLLAEAEWHAGWLALRFLNNPKAAVEHFKIMYEGVNYPISKSRGAYWLGKLTKNLEKIKKQNNGTHQHLNLIQHFMDN